jgi:uncharacterized protein YoxC
MKKIITLVYLVFLITTVAIFILVVIVILLSATLNLVGDIIEHRRDTNQLIQSYEK